MDHTVWSILVPRRIGKTCPNNIDLECSSLANSNHSLKNILLAKIIANKMDISWEFDIWWSHIKVIRIFGRYVYIWQSSKFADMFRPQPIRSAFWNSRAISRSPNKLMNWVKVVSWDFRKCRPWKSKSLSLFYTSQKINFIVKFTRFQSLYFEFSIQLYKILSPFLFNIIDTKT